MRNIKQEKCYIKILYSGVMREKVSWGGRASQPYTGGEERK